MRSILSILILLGCEEAQPLCSGGDCTLSCAPSDPCCAPFALSEEECGADPSVSDGWNDAPGSGAVFVVNALAIAGADRGFNLDGVCDESGCIDNVMSALGELGNDQIRQGLLGGETLVLVEVAGVVNGYRGWDRSVTVKIYGARDADDPFFPANNFKVPPGHQTCCEFEIHPDSLADNQPLARLPARIRDGLLESIERSAIAIPLKAEEPPDPRFDYGRAGIIAELTHDLTQINVGLLSGALLVRTTADIENPYCKTVSPRCPVQFTRSSMVELLMSLSIEPDIDLDGDGLECVLDTNGDGAIDRCCEQCAGNECTGAVIAPVEAGLPWTCAHRMNDGYSMSVSFTGVDATIVGIAP